MTPYWGTLKSAINKGRLERDPIHLATVDTTRLPLSLLDEVAEERGAWRKRHMVDVAVQGLVHSEHEPGHTTSFPHAASARF